MQGMFGASTGTSILIRRLESKGVTMEVIKKLLRDRSSSLLLVVGYCLLFFIAFNGMYLIYRMSEQQPDTVIGNYRYKEGGRILRATKKTEASADKETESKPKLSDEEKVDYAISLLDTKYGNTCQ